MVGLFGITSLGAPLYSHTHDLVERVCLLELVTSKDSLDSNTKMQVIGLVPEHHCIKAR